MESTSKPDFSEVQAVRKNGGRRRPRSPEQVSNGKRLLSRIESLEAEVSLLRNALAHDKRLCRVKHCRRTFSSPGHVSIHIRGSGDPGDKDGRLAAQPPGHGRGSRTARGGRRTAKEGGRWGGGLVVL